jgi:hypothetical protein
MPLSRHRKAAFFAQRSQRPGVGERYPSPAGQLYCGGGQTAGGAVGKEAQMVVVAAGAVAVDLQAPVHAEVGQLAVTAAQGAFTAEALAAAQRLQRSLVADLALALLLGSGLLRLLAQQVGVQPADQGPAAEEGEQGPTP